VTGFFLLGQIGLPSFRYLIDKVKLDSFSLKTRLRLGMERLWFRSRIACADEIIVQTPSMKSLLESQLTSKAAIKVLPFMGDGEGVSRYILSSEMEKERDFDFLYVASGDPHKNDRQLVEARQACLSVLASELDYVRDVLDPDQSFDPNSKVSIARAVKRFFGIAEEGAPLLDAHGFLEKL